MKALAVAIFMLTVMDYALTMTGINKVGIIGLHVRWVLLC